MEYIAIDIEKDVKDTEEVQEQHLSNNLIKSRITIIICFLQVVFLLQICVLLNFRPCKNILHPSSMLDYQSYVVAQNLSKSTNHSDIGCISSIYGYNSTNIYTVSNC